MKDEWKKNIRELKILRAKKQSGGWLPPKDAKRLEWLEERFGDAPEIERIQIDEPVDSGPKVKTAEHGYATEVSQKLLKDAEKYKLTKAWEKEEQRKKRAFAARERREGEKTFKQAGLSGFAVEATEDMKSGEIGLAEVPREEEQGEKKAEYGQVVYAQDESERLTKKNEGTSPFALNISDRLSRGLDKHKEYDDKTVPDTGAKSFEVDLDDEELKALENLDRAAIRADEIPKSLQGLLKKSYDLSKDEGPSEGERSTHQAGDIGEDLSTLDLMRQAVEYTEERGAGEEADQVFEIDEEGNVLPYEEQVEDLSTAVYGAGTGETVEAEIPDPGASEDLAVLVPDPPETTAGKKPRFSDTAPTRPGVAPSEMATEMGEALQVPEPITEEDEVLEIDGDDIMEVPLEVEMQVDHSSQAEVAATMEPQTRAGDVDGDVDEDVDDVDKFWGLSAEAPAAPPPPEPPTIPQQQKPAAPPHRPKKPLPALSVAPPRPPLPREEQPARPAPGRVDRNSIHALFEDAEIDTGAGAEIAPAEPAGPKPAASFAAGTTQPVDVPPGPRKATVHFKDGVTRRGVVDQIDTDADLLHLKPPQGSSAPAEDLVALALKTIFLMLPRGGSKPRVNGPAVRLVLIDGRSLEGVTSDYDPHRKAFTLFPKGARGNIERIIVFNDAVKNIWFD